MPGVPLQPVRSGQPWTPPTASDHNLILAAARAHGLEGNAQPAAHGTRTGGAGSGLIRVINDTGSALDRFAIAGIGEPILGDAANPNAFARQIGFRVVATDAELHAQPPRLVVAQQPIAAGRGGWAALDGPTHALIDGEADPATVGLASNGDDSLTSGEAGYDVLWSAAGSGRRLATLRRSGGGGTGIESMDFVRYGGFGDNGADAFAVPTLNTSAEPEPIAFHGAAPALAAGDRIMVVSVPGLSGLRVALTFIPRASPGLSLQTLPDGRMAFDELHWGA